ncbi:hypothetical protein [Klebsiella pneumoniae]|uniref:hypothetical protein n=1 Tax=Klebsiella pneumoniae TaxID=573 RepID=UPI0009BAB65D|nr:hypothetical protein [Klebsiella pneumoniae]SLS86307.1 Uncharacterised protein [Klebsiella pneumoniae]SLS94082.1 Uncharacterised protein [Klebsiella pneumoniae]SLT00408.1 Uncharacterised protein [Klebsiella pneumoniae]SLT01741.1 Uncharacterised protein [Klebsiella pneumoniae]SLT16134.1 Uncharacterised protein [Klebsiella pneumoniae]
MKTSIAPILFGRNIANISEKHFTPWFCPYDHYPGLVLASTITVSYSPSPDWFLGEEQCGGHSCNQFRAAIKPLQIIPQSQVQGDLELIASEGFEPGTLDYFSLADDEVQKRVRLNYQSFVMNLGLTCSDENVLLLTQPLYPLDATESNLRALTTDQTCLSGLTDTTGLVIFVVGVNCD